MFADHVVPFVFENIAVRGEVILLSRTWRRILKGHRYDPAVAETLGHAAAATGLIAQSLKFDGAITLQIQGTGDLRMLVMQCSSALELRGMATTADEVTARSFGELIQRGHCAITVDSGDRPYQGIVEVDARSLASSLENYFARSVQVPSHVVLLATGDFAAGLLLQQMPGQVIDADDWQRLGLLAATLAADDFAGGSGLDLIRKLFNEDDVRVFDGKPVMFRCRCSRRRAGDVLRMLGEQEVSSVVAEQGRVDVTCEYCGRRQRFDPVDVSRLFVAHSVSGPESIQ